MISKTHFLVFVVIIVFTTFAINISTSEATQESLAKSFEGLKNDLKDISNSVASLMDQKEGEFKEKLEQYRDDLNTNVDELEKKVSRMSGESKEKINQYVEMLKEKNRELTERAKSVLTGARKKFSEKLNETLSTMEKDLNELGEKAKTMSKEAQEKLAQRLKEMRDKNKDIMKKMDELKSKGIESLDDIKNLVFGLWNELKDIYDTELHGTDYEKI
jgi:ElaB/YqjD/DUF883 family membrane-anchored ribosome-binding protein